MSEQWRVFESAAHRGHYGIETNALQAIAEGEEIIVAPTPSLSLAVATQIVDAANKLGAR